QQFPHSMNTPSHQPFQHQGPTMTLFSIKSDAPMMSGGSPLGQNGPIAMGSPSDFGEAMSLGFGVDSLGGPRRKRAKIEIIE
ncbi:hypothetical protein BGX28_009636, partial [Mortierella sp. GBA30]